MLLFLKANSLLISAPKSSVTLFTPDPAQAHYHPAVRIEGLRLPLERSPKLLGVYLDTFFSFNYHCGPVATRVKKRNNVLKTLVGTSWGQQKETLQITYKALERSIANYAAPVWSSNAGTSSIESIQRAQNEALRIITVAHKMSSIDHLHCETEMLCVEEHFNPLSVQYQIQCLEPDSACNNITRMDTPLRMKKTIQPLLSDTKQKSLQAAHTEFVGNSLIQVSTNRVLGYRPPPINEEAILPRHQRTVLSQLRSGHCQLINNYKKRSRHHATNAEQTCRMSITCSLVQLTRQT